MSIKNIAAIAIAAVTSLAAMQAGANPLSNAEASRGEQLRDAMRPVASATVQPQSGVSTNDFLQEAERGEYMRAAAVSQDRVMARQATAFDGLLPSEAARGAL